MHMRFTTTVLLLAGLMMAGCREQTPQPVEKTGSATSETRELVVLCGSSFVPPADELIKAFTDTTGVNVITMAAGSEDFLPHVKTKTQGDILITHDPYLDYVKDADAHLDDAPVGFVAPVLAVATGNPKGLTRIEDLAQEGLRVALSNPQYSTCGEMVFALLEKKGIKDAVLKNVGNRLTKGHGNLGAFVQTGAVDAVIMWNGVAHTFKEHLAVVPTPYEYGTTIRVHVIGLSYSQQPDVVRQFVGFAKQKGKAIFASHGYVK